MAKPLKLQNGLSWSTRTAAKLYFKEMLARYSNGDTINTVDQSDLAALLAHYDSSVEIGMPTKSGVGIAYFKRQSNADIGWPSDSFHVYRIDGTSTDFSYIHAVNS